MTLTNQLDANFIDTNFLFEDRMDAHYYSNKFYAIEKKIKSSPFEVKKFIDIAKKIKCGPFGSSVLAENYDETGIIMVRPLNLKDVLLSNDDLVRFPEKALSKNFPIFKSQDLLFARVGMPSCSIIPETFENVTISPNIIATELLDSVDAYYITTFMNTPYGLSQIERRFKAVSQPTVSTEELKTIEIVLPDIKYQKHIGDKVRKAEQLREEAKCLKEEAESILYNQLNLEVLSLSLEDSKKTSFWVNSEKINLDRLDSHYYDISFMIIDNFFENLPYKYEPVGSLIDHTSTGDKIEETNNGKSIYFIQSGDIAGNFLDLTEEKRKIVLKANKRVEFSDLLFAKDGETIGKLAPCNIDEEIYTNEHIIISRLKDEYKSYCGYIYYFLTTEIGNMILKREATGTAQKGLSKFFLNNIKIPIIPRDIIIRLQDINVEVTNKLYLSRRLILEAKQEIESLIEGTFNAPDILQEE